MNQLIEVLKMIQLVDNAKQAWRWFSMQAMALAMALQGTWALLDADLRANLSAEMPKGMISIITIILLAAGMAGRLVAQPPKPTVPEQPTKATDPPKDGGLP